MQSNHYVTTALCLGLHLLTFASPTNAEAPPHETSWIGNSFGGGPRGKWVQNFVFMMAVNADGRCFTCSHWDEAHREAGIYQDGDVVGNCKGAIGDAVAANGRFVFLGDGGRARPGEPGGATVKQFTFEGSPTKVTFPLKNMARALAANEQVLVAADAVDNRVHVFEVEGGKLLRSLDVEKPGAVAVTAAGDMWVVTHITRQAFDGRYWMVDRDRPAKVLHFDKDGNKVPGEVTGDSPDWKPTCLAFDNAGRLMVGDDGPRHQVLFYDVTAEPKLVSAFGAKGGIGSGTPGEVAPDKLWGITGVGTDKAGNLYVSQSEQGCVIRSFAPGGKLRWELMNLIFVDCAGFDPASDGADVYGKQEHWVMDYSKPAGKEATLKGYTLDATKYPQDPRLWMANDGHALMTADVRRLNNGKRYMFLTGMSSENLAIYRFDGEVAVPAGLILKKRYNSRAAPGYPPHQPDKGEWIWRDANGDGKFDAGEFAQPPNAQSYAERWNWWVDSRGDVWTDLPNGIRRLPLQGFDDHGNPIYTYESAEVIPFPEPFNRVNRIEYEPATDTMYLTGYTADAPYNGKFWKEAGRVTVRYDDWSKPARKARWTLKHQWEEGRPYATPHSISVAGDRLFVGYFHRGGPVIDRVYDALTGKLVGEIKPGAEVGGVIGDIDAVQAIRAVRRKDGTYLILQEDDRYGKVVLFRWNRGEPSP